MTSTSLKNIRTSLNLDIKSMAQVLGWPYRTYQDRELGNRGIPEKAAQQVMHLQQTERQAMARVMGKVDAMIDRQFPGGIVSEPDPE